MTHSRWWALVAATLLIGAPAVRACDKAGSGSAKGCTCPAAKSCCECSCEAKASKCEGKCCASCQCKKDGCCAGKCEGKCCAGACSDKCKCCADCQCKKEGCCAGKCCSECKDGCCASDKLPKCCCPAGTKCVTGCTPDACPCGKKDGASSGVKKKTAAKKKVVRNKQSYIGGCLVEMAPMPQPLAEGQPLCPGMSPVLMFLESLCPPPYLPPPPFQGLMPAGFPPPPCCSEACPCPMEDSRLCLRHESDGIHVSSPYLKECVCQKVSLCGPMGCLMLEHVKLVAGGSGSKVHIVADKLCLDPRTGRIQLETGKGPGSAILPACFEFWGGFFE